MFSFRNKLIFTLLLLCLVTLVTGEIIDPIKIAEENGSDYYYQEDYPQVEEIVEEVIWRDKWNIYPPDTDYYKPEQLLPAIQKMENSNPSRFDWYIVGESSKFQLPIYAFRITNKNLDKPKPKILFHGQHHSEEVIGLEIVMYMSRYFLEQYHLNQNIKYLIDNYELWFIPTSNPEGFHLVNSGKYRMKRKNETDTNFNGIREFEKDGVDLNRNYDFNWEKDNAVNNESPYFKGYEPACQSETRAMQRFYAEQQFNLAFFFHSSATGAYSERIFFPWKWDDIYSPDYEEMLHLARFWAKHLSRNYTAGNYRVQQFNTSQRGFARDYIYSQHNTLAMLVEVGGNSPYGDGVLSPPNDVLRSLLQQHTEAMIKLLGEYNKNVITVQVVDNHSKPIRDVEIIIEGKESPYKKNIKTNNRGYFAHYFLPRQEPYNLIIGNESFQFTKSKPGKDNFIFTLYENQAQDIKIDKINNGEAIVMINPVFQYFPPLQVTGSNIGRITPVVSLIDEYSIAFRQNAAYQNNSISIPWIPVDALDRGVMTVQYRDISPLADNNKIANKILFLNKDEEVLTYCFSVISINSCYLHPGSKIGIDFTLYPAGDNDYLIKGIKIYGRSHSKTYSLNLSLYDGAKPVGKTIAKYQGKANSNLQGEFKHNEDNHFLTALKEEIPLPDNLFLIIENNGFSTVAIDRDRNEKVSSNRNMVYFSNWQHLEGSDLAVEIILKRKH